MAPPPNPQSEGLAPAKETSPLSQASEVGTPPRYTLPEDVQAFVCLWAWAIPLVLLMLLAGARP